MTFLTLIILLIILSLYQIYKKLQVPKEIAHLPGFPLWDTILSIYNNESLDKVNLRVHQKILNENGVARMWLFGKWAVVISDEEAAKDIYLHSNDYPKVLVSDLNPEGAFSKFNGINIVFSNGDEWKKHRKVVNPTFKRNFNTEIFANATYTLCKQIEKNGFENFPVNDYMQRLSLDVLGKAVFDLEFGSIENPNIEFITRYNRIMKEHFSLLNILFPFLNRDYNPLFKQSHLNVQWLKNEFMSILKQKKELLNDDEKDLDLLSSMIKSAETEDVDFDESDMINNCMIFFLAGHDTTATALSAALHFLAKYPDIQNKCRKEVNEILGKETKAPSHEQLRSMDYLTAVIKESMRLYPSVARLPAKTSQKELKIGDFTVPKGTIVAINTLSMHMNEKIFENPTQFDPNRFFNNQNYGVNYSPFSSGSRHCLGMGFSMDEQRVVLSILINKYQITYHKGCENESLPIGFGSLLQVGPVHLDFVPI